MPTPTTFALKVPSPALAGGTIWCEITRTPLRIGDDGILRGLSEEQAAQFIPAGYVPVEDGAVLLLKRTVDAYARSSAAFSVAEDAVAIAIRSARAEGLDEEAIGRILDAAGRMHQTVLPDANTIAGRPPMAEKEAPAPAVEPPVVVPPLPAPQAPPFVLPEKKPGRPARGSTK